MLSWEIALQLGQHSLPSRLGLHLRHPQTSLYAALVRTVLHHDSVPTCGHYLTMFVSLALSLTAIALKFW